MADKEKHERKKSNKRVSFRLNLLFIIIFALFTVLIIRLAFIQIVNGEQYIEEIEKMHMPHLPYRQHAA